VSDVLLGLAAMIGVCLVVVAICGWANLLLTVEKRYGSAWGLTLFMLPVFIGGWILFTLQFAGVIE